MVADPHTHSLLPDFFDESEIINLFADNQPVSLQRGTTGIGDDCAVLSYGKDTMLLVAADLMAEHIHFLKDQSSPEDIGYKVVAVNVSDIAAMGGTPKAVMLSLALPENITADWIRKFRKGFFAAIEEFECPLVGGDTSRSDRDIFANVSIIGKVPSSQLKLRKGSQPGDRICVTGPLGDSAAGLKLLSGTGRKKLDSKHFSYLLDRHLRPKPDLEEGIWLGKQPEVHAMIDVSDGLARDARHLSVSGNVGMEIEINDIPLSEAFKAFVKGAGDETEWYKLAAAGGEDYHLLCTVDADEFQHLFVAFQEEFGHPLYPVGTVTGEHRQVKFFQDGEPLEIHQHGFEHFK